jgi:hypothetical protein
MPTESVSTESVDYLQRCGWHLQPVRGALTQGVPAARRLLWVRGIGRPDKDLKPSPFATKRWRPRSADLITGLYGNRIPIAFRVGGSVDGVRIQLGTWSAKDPNAEIQDRRLAVIRSVLRSLYPAVRVETPEDEPSRWPLSGLALGTPAPVRPEQADQSAPIDRVIRSLSGTSWSALILAYPARSDPTASSTAWTSFVRCSRVGSGSGWGRSDRPVPLLSNKISLEKEARRSRKCARGEMSHARSRCVTHPGDRTRSMGPSPTTW